jgi:hypothetical protein
MALRCSCEKIDSRHVLAQQAVCILAGTALLGTVRVVKVNLYAGTFGQQVSCCIEERTVDVAPVRAPRCDAASVALLMSKASRSQLQISQHRRALNLVARIVLYPVTRYNERVIIPSFLILPLYSRTQPDA